MAPAAVFSLFINKAKLLNGKTISWEVPCVERGKYLLGSVHSNCYKKKGNCLPFSGYMFKNFLHGWEKKKNSPQEDEIAFSF